MSTSLGRRAAGAILTAALAFAGAAVAAPAATAVPRPAGATVTVTSSTGALTGLSPDATTTLTVEGSGFDPSLATGSRAPLAGKPSGAYVIFGRFADEWAYSDGVPSSARTVLKQSWAVSAGDMAAIGGASRGAIELTPEGTFSTTFEVTATEAGRLATGNYGIYTYAGGGSSVAAYNTYTPISFAGALPSISRAPESQSAVLGATAAFSIPAVAAGERVIWQTRKGSGLWTTVPGASTSTLSVQATDDLNGNQYRAVVSNALGTAYSVPATLTVTPAPAPVPVPVPAPAPKAAAVITAPSSVRFASVATVSVKGAAGKSAPTGTVTIEFGTKVVGTATLKNGAARIKLSTKLPVAAKRSLTFTYGGDSDYAAATVKRNVKVAKAAAKAAAKLAKKKVTTKAKAKVTVTVSASGTTPSGKVKVTATKGKKTVTRTVTLTKGKAKATLPRLAKGTWKVKAKYLGSSKVSGKTARTVTLKVR